MRRQWDPGARPKRSDRLKVLLLLPEDEVALQAAIVAEHPSVRIVDKHAPWPAASTSRPPVRGSMLDVEQTAVIWEPEIHPRLPQPRFSGLARRSPQAGRVVAWSRGTCVDGVLSTSVISAVVWDGHHMSSPSASSEVWLAT